LAAFDFAKTNTITWVLALLIHDDFMIGIIYPSFDEMTSAIIAVAAAEFLLELTLEK
jgi:hypothetical protein